MSFPRYPKYKDSGVEWLGEVPEHWEVTRYKTVFKERSERSEAGQEELLSVSAYFGVRPRSGMVDDGEYLTRAESLIDYKICHSGDLVMNIMLAWNRGLGFARQTGIVSPAYCVFRVIKNSNTKYLDYLVRDDLTIPYFKAFSAGVIDSRLRLYPETFGSLYLALPPLDEQTRIAEFLDRETGRMDALIEEQKRLIELLKEKRQALISHVVTKGLNPDAPMKDSGVEWLGKVPKHWEVKRLKFLCKINTGSKDTINSIVDGEYPFFVRSQQVERIDTYTFDGEAVLTAGDGAGVGKVFHHFTGKFDYHQRVYALYDFQQLLGRFLFHYLRENFYKVALAGEARSTVDSLRLPLFLNFNVTVPPINEQAAIITSVDNFLSKVENLQNEAEAAIRLMQERRSALISAAVTGKIKVA